MSWYKLLHRQPKLCYLKQIFVTITKTVRNCHCTNRSLTKIFFSEKTERRQIHRRRICSFWIQPPRSRNILRIFQTFYNITFCQNGELLKTAADLVTFTKDILNGKLRFLCKVLFSQIVFVILHHRCFTRS